MSENGSSDTGGREDVAVGGQGDVVVRKAERGWVVEIGRAHV